MIKSLRIKKTDGMILDVWMKKNRYKMREAIKECEVIHILISIGLQRLKVDENGELFFD